MARPLLAKPLGSAAQTATLAGTPYRKWLDEDVVYVIQPEEREAFLRLQTDDEREKFIEQFWLRRDPTPGTVENEYKEEHYRRIAYANEHFAEKVEGWRTDRGHIYIVYGPPDEIEDHRAGGGNANYPYQQWRYRWIDGIGQNVIIEFADTDRNGVYRMTMDPSEKQRLLRDQGQAQPPNSGDDRRSQLLADAHARIQQAEAQLAQLQTSYAPDHPSVLRAETDLVFLYRARAELLTEAQAQVAADGSFDDLVAQVRGHNLHSVKSPGVELLDAQFAALRQATAQPAASASSLPGLDDQIRAAEQNLALLRTQYTDSHPEVKKTQAQLEVLRALRNTAAMQQDITRSQAAQSGADAAAPSVPPQNSQNTNPLPIKVGVSQAPIPGSAQKMVIVSITTDPSIHALDIIGRITDLGRRRVAAFEGTQTGSDKYEKSLPLAPGEYRLNVVVKEIDTGAIGMYEEGLVVGPNAAAPSVSDANGHYMQLRPMLAAATLGEPSVSDANKYYMQGMVKKPGPYNLGSGKTMFEALAEAGGLVGPANLQRIRIIRRSKDGKNTEELTYDLASGSAFQLEPGDIVAVLH